MLLCTADSAAVEVTPFVCVNDPNICGANNGFIAPDPADRWPFDGAGSPEIAPVADCVSGEDSGG